MRSFIFMVFWILAPAYLFAADLAFLGCDPHADCMRDVSYSCLDNPFKKCHQRVEDPFCAGTRTTCAAVDCPKLSQDVGAHFAQINGTRDQVNSEITSNAQTIVSNEAIINQTQASITTQASLCTNLDSFRALLVTDFGKKNEFVTLLSSVANTNAANKSQFLEQIDLLPTQNEIKTFIKNIIQFSDKSTNDIKLIVDQYNRNNSTGIDELVLNANSQCENSKAKLASTSSDLSVQQASLVARQAVLAATIAFQKKKPG